MKLTVANFARAFDALWTIGMGLFLGLCGGLVLAVILAFKGTRELEAVPGIAPYNNAQFATHHADAIAGYIGQDLFVIGGSAALVLLGLALLARIGNALFMMVQHRPTTGSATLGKLRMIALVFCILCMVKGASLTVQMNNVWPGLYDTKASESTIETRRAAFQSLHKKSERFVGAAWLGGLFALSVSPWCRRPADSPLQSADGKKESKQKEIHTAREA